MTTPLDPDLDFPTALRTAIAERGLSLDRLRWHLSARGHEVSVATLSYWQSGRSLPSRATSLVALAALEEILELPAGELARRLPERRRGPGAPSQPGRTFAEEVFPFLEDAMEELGLEWDPGVRRASAHDRVIIDADRRGVLHHARELYVAERDGVDRVPIFVRTETPEESGTLLPVRHCSLGRGIDIPGQHVRLHEMLFDRTLDEGESLLIEHDLRIRSATVMEPQVERLFGDQVRAAHTEIVFPPDQVPLAAERYTIAGGVERTEPIVILGPSLHALVLDFGPGGYGIRWTW